MSDETPQIREFGRFRIDARKKTLWYDNEPVPMPLKEIELLSVLVENRGELVTKDELLEQVWQDAYVEESNLSRHIYLIRKTLRQFGESDDLIQNVPRRGYRFTGEVREISAGDVVVEKHTSTRTLIEIHDEAAEPQPARLTARAVPATRRTLAVLLPALVLLAAAIGAAAYFMSLEKAVPAAPEPIDSIAVLPVRSFSDDTGDSGLRMRITDALITRLGSAGRVAVRPTSAVMPFADSPLEVLEIGRRLQVDAVLEGRVQQEGDRLRVTAQLIRVSDGEHLWSEQFDGRPNRLLDLQDMIASGLSRFLEPGERPGPQIPGRPTDNADAYEAYLQGRYFWYKRDAGSLERAREHFSQAAALDPQFAGAYAALADTEHLIFNYNIDVSPEIVASANENLHRALSLDPDSADALLTLGTIQMGADWNWAGAEDSFRRAVAAAPNSSVARMRYGALLIRLKRFDEAKVEFERAIDLDPLSIVNHTNLGLLYFCMADLDAADRQYRKVLEFDETIGATHWLLSRSLWMSGRQGESVGEIVRALELDNNQPLADKIREAARSSPADAVKALLYEWRSNPLGTNPHNLAYLSTYIDDREKALYWLERSYGEHHPWTPWILAAPEFQILSNEPRYKTLLQKMNLDTFAGPRSQ